MKLKRTLVAIAGLALVLLLAFVGLVASPRAPWRRLRGEQLDVEVLAPAHSAPRQGTAAFQKFADARS